MSKLKWWITIKKVIQQLKPHLTVQSGWRSSNTANEQNKRIAYYFCNSPATQR
ncbi:hypothetical protein J6590_078565 [Homalodisca vitripennis]|nr:hypothetical protein J6590_078565 [Homalodisca vitripennis]